MYMGSPTEREARDKDIVNYTAAHSWRRLYFQYTYAGAGERKDGQASGWHAFFRNMGRIQEFQTYPSYLQCTERLSAPSHWTGVLPKWVLHREDDHIGLKPHLVANREFFHILVPFVGRNDRTSIAEEITPHVRTGWAVP